MDLIYNSLIILIAYLFGSLSSAIIVCKLMGKPDPRTQGSNNPGATNVLRIAGKGAAALTLVGDVLKGIIPILIARYFDFSSSIVGAVAFAAFVGHLFPLFFRFQGGKGVATLLGCLIALNLPTALAWGLTWLLIAALFRYSSLASLGACILAPMMLWQFTQNEPYTLSIAGMLPFLVWRHRNNIYALMHGNERKIGKRK